MDKKFSISTAITAEGATISLIGVIDEDVNFTIISNLQVKKYIFDFEQVQLINSCGIREWINYIEKLSLDSQIIYKNCPQIVIEQINMVHGFIQPNTIVESFYAPYYCEHCDNEEKILLDGNMVEDSSAPSICCKKCSKEMTFDSIEKQYFNFLQR